LPYNSVMVNSRLFLLLRSTNPTRLALRLWFALAALPYPLYRVAAGAVSALLASLLMLLPIERRRVLWVNLALCFPQVGCWQRLLWAWQHGYVYFHTFLDRAWLWSVPAHVLKERVAVVDLAEPTVIPTRATPSTATSPPAAVLTVWLAPHFLGLDAAWARLCLDHTLVTMYSNQKNVLLNACVRQGRARFGAPLLVSRQEGVRPLLAAMRQGRALYYLPDLDFGERDAVFVRFFGVQAATVSALPRMVRLLGGQEQVQVRMVTTRWHAGRYTVTLHPPVHDVPWQDTVAATQVISSHIETAVRANVPQYLWLHKRFKTRPQGQRGVYR
jgi:KDO2-lipid IV(A) lauroyltransferase